MKRRNTFKWSPEYKTRKWYAGCKHPGILYLNAIFRVELADTVSASINKRKATKKGYNHLHNSAGTKILRKHNCLPLTSG